MGRPQTLETRQKISEALKKPRKNKICPGCGLEFTPKRNHIQFCSRLCAAKQPKPKGKDRKPGSGGARPGGGRSKQISYTNWLGEEMKLNPEEIEVAKVLDEKKLQWSRNWKGFPYKDWNGKNRKFYPDFSINDSVYIEYKGWITPKMKYKMDMARKTNDLELVVIVGKDPRYVNEGISLDDFRKIF